MARLKSWHLFAICVLVWGSTWHAITYQIGHTAPDVGVALRFGLAGFVILAMCVARGDRLRFSRAQHGRFALQGVFMYGVSYICVYEAERYLPSGWWPWATPPRHCSLAWARRCSSAWACRVASSRAACWAWPAWR